MPRPHASSFQDFAQPYKSVRSHSGCLPCSTGFWNHYGERYPSAPVLDCALSGGRTSNHTSSHLSRREFAASLAVAQSPPPPGRLNVLLITNDQFRADCLGALGNPIIHTPNLDRLASEGMLFEQYFVQCPQCVPSRSPMHTGRYPHTNRTPSNLYRLPETEKTLAMILGSQGY